MPHCPRTFLCLAGRQCVFSSESGLEGASPPTGPSHAHILSACTASRRWLRLPRGVLPLVNLTNLMITSEFPLRHFPPTSPFNSAANSQQPDCLLKPTANTHRALYKQQRAPLSSSSLFQVSPTMEGPQPGREVRN